MGRPPRGGGGAGAGAPAQRVVHIDANVCDQICRGNQPAAQRLRALLNDPNVTVRISPAAYAELVTQPAIPRTAAANRQMLTDLHIPQATTPTQTQRIETGALGQSANQAYRGAVASIRDVQVIASARLENAEIWSFDTVFRTNAGGVQQAYGVAVAPESQNIGLVPHGATHDYRVGRQLMGLPEIDISVGGAVTFRGGGGPPGGGGGPGPSQRAPGRLRQGLRIAGYAGASAVGFLLTLLIGGTIAKLQESSMQRQRSALEPRIRKDFRQLKEQAIRLLVAGKQAHLVLHFKTESQSHHMGPGVGWAETWPKLEYLGMEIRESPVGPVGSDGKTEWVQVGYDRGGRMITPGAMSEPSYWYDQSAALSLSPEDAAVYRSYFERIDFLSTTKTRVGAYDWPTHLERDPADPAGRTREQANTQDANVLWLELQALLDVEETLAP